MADFFIFVFWLVIALLVLSAVGNFFQQLSWELSEMGKRISEGTFWSGGVKKTKDKPKLN